MIFRNSVIIF